MRLNNATTTLAHGLGSSQGRLVRIEVFIFLSTLIWLLLEMFGSYRRRYSHRFLRVFVWTVYTLFTVLIPYTIGLLQDSLFRDQTFALWGTVILFIQLSSDSISVYSIQDIEQRKRMLVQHVLQIILVLWMIVNGKGHNKCYSATTWMLWIWSVLMTYRKSRALSKASKKGGMLEHSKVVADYMMVEHEQTSQQVVGTNQSTVSMMDRYRYIFHGEEELASMLPIAPQYRFELKESTITIDSVWRWLDSRGDLAENVQTMKDVTLSFTLFKLLKRRFCGYQLGEVGLPKTKDFVFHVLMSESQSQNASNGYLGAFRVIELELAFLYDFFYTRSDLESRTYLGCLMCIVVPFVIVWNFISGAFSRHYHRSNMQQRVNETDVIHGATIVLFAVWLIVRVSTGFCHRETTKWELVDMIQNFMAGRTAPYVNSIANAVKKEQATHLLWERKLGQYTMLHLET